MKFRWLWKALAFAAGPAPRPRSLGAGTGGSMRIRFCIANSGAVEFKVFFEPIPEECRLLPGEDIAVEVFSPPDFIPRLVLEQQSLTIHALTVKAARGERVVFDYGVERGHEHRDSTFLAFRELASSLRGMTGQAPAHEGPGLWLHHGAEILLRVEGGPDPVRLLPHQPLWIEPGASKNLRISLGMPGTIQVRGHLRLKAAET